MIRKIKYYGNRRFADIAGKFLYTKLIHIVNGQNLDKDLPILLIPVPISSKRLRQRGYNQVVLITKSVLAQDEKHLFGDGACIVTKIKDTQSQTMCTRKQRLTNLSGVFHVSNPEKVIHRVVVLIDDVTTTGTTFSEISRVLMSAGAKRVITLALAH
jgi:ComF family protein